MTIFKDSRPRLGQDPFIIRYKGFLLLIESQDEKRILIRDFNGSFDPIVVWEDPAEYQLWSPELHEIDNWWYIYYTASDGQNRNHRTYVLEAPNLFGPYHKYQIGLDIWGIDMTVFRHNRIWYAAWSGWEQNGDEFPQHLYIAEMYSPTKVNHRIKISSPQLSWEKSHAPILEGPQAFHSPSGTLFISYAANASWTQEYSTGLLELTGDDPLNPEHWVKHPKPLLVNGGHGHPLEGSFVYHRKLSSFPGWNDREIRVSPFHWNNNLPIIGRVV